MTLEHEELTGQIIGAAIEVHKELGPGFVESIYENALAVELRRRKISFHRQLSAPVLYKDVEVGLHRLDLLVEAEIVVELKAVRDLTDTHFAFVRSYLHSSEYLRRSSCRVVSGSPGSFNQLPRSGLPRRAASRRGRSYFAI